MPERVAGVVRYPDIAAVPARISEVCWQAATILVSMAAAAIYGAYRLARRVLRCQLIGADRK